MQFSFKINSGNQAVNDDDAASAIADMMRSYADKIEAGEYDLNDDSAVLLDYNGNAVGRLEFGIPDPLGG